MTHQYLNLNSQKDLVEGVILRKLTIHTDPTGSLVETLRTDWNDVFDSHKMPFAMQYMSQTPPGVARDENQWHVHKNQKDRFICISGQIVTAVFDPRENSKTKDKLNLFIMSPQKEEEMYMLVIPENTYHGFMVVSKEEGRLLNFPTQLYTGEDEGRVKHENFSWQGIRDDFNIKP